MTEQTTNWRNYEEVAVHLLNQFAFALGLSHVEEKQSLSGNSGTNWEVDGKGVRVGDQEAIIVVECRRYSHDKQSQEKIAALAYRISDTGAQGGLIVSPLGLQAGATKVAAAENIESVHLDKDCSRSEYVMSFLNRIFVGIADTITITDTVTAHVVRGDDIGD